MKKAVTTVDPEIAAISTVHAALQGLEPDAQTRVLNYVAGKLRLPELGGTVRDQEPVRREAGTGIDRPEPPRQDEEPPHDDADGISPSGAKWMKRSGLQASSLERLFSIGGDEIDLIAESVPGTNKKDRMRSVLLLKGIAAYLATGAARFTHEQMKDACVHYDAFDAANFAAYFRSMSSEVTGGKGEGYTLTPRGIAGATEIVKAIVKEAKPG